MKLLDITKYDKVIDPLREVKINNLFARSVAEKKVNGTIYVDNTDTPNTFYVLHPYGMSLLFGEADNDEFNSNFIDYALNKFTIRNNHEWLQVYPDLWNNKISMLLGNKLIKSKDNQNNDKKKIEVNTRVNFKFNREKFFEFKKPNIKDDYKILRTDKELFEKMQGRVVPKYFWNDAEHFCNDGIGFSMIYGDKLASTAYSSYIIGNQLELGIETINGFRGKGFAAYVCAFLIDYCLNNNFDPVWSCSLENMGSYKLAQKLGFEPSLYLPYYRLIG